MKAFRCPNPNCGTAGERTVVASCSGDLLIVSPAMRVIRADGRWWFACPACDGLVWWVGDVAVLVDRAA